jgi:hypothetical protein
MEGQYEDNLYLFVVHLNAGARGSGNTPGMSDWADWAVDCTDPAEPVVTAYVGPWDADWFEEQGDLNP